MPTCGRSARETERSAYSEAAMPSSGSVDDSTPARSARATCIIWASPRRLQFARADLVTWNPRAGCKSSGFASLKHLEQAGCAHTAADAHRNDNIFDAAAPALDQCMACGPGPRHAIRVAGRDRPPVDVQAMFPDAHLL